MPEYGAVPRECGAVYDPVTGQMHPNRAALSLSPTSSASESRANGPRIEVADNVALHLDAFTIEMFIARGTDNRPYGDTIISKFVEDGPSSASGSMAARYAYEIHRAQKDTDNHWFAIHYKVQSTDRWASTTPSASPLSGNVLRKTGFWDHIALVSDVANKSVKLYVNYQLAAEKTLGSDEYYMDYGSGQPILLGSNGYGSFGGMIDEFRISDTTLTPSQFLRMCSPIALPETTHFYTFDAPTNFSWNSIWPWRNLAPVAYEGSGKSMVLYKIDYPTVGPDSDTMPGSIIRSGLLSDVSVENNASFHTSTNQPAADATSAYFKAFGRTRFFATDFTFEMAFKMPPQPTDAALPGASDSSFLVFAGLWGIRVFRGANKQLSFYDGAGNYDLGRYTDSEWHRLAYVFEKDSGEHRIYVDGVQKFAKTRSRNPDTADEWYLLSDGNAWGSSWGLNLSAGWIDDVRVTEKALRPCEFLTSVPKEDGSTLAWYSFENESLDNGVYTNAIGAGASGGTAAFYGKTPGQGKELWDSTETKIRDNATALAINGGKAVWPRNSLLEREDLTVEFFARQTAASANAGIVSAMRSDSGTNSTAIAATDAIWSIRVGSDGKTPEVYVSNGTEQTVAFPASSALGAAWRHYAVTFAPNGDDTAVKLYCNHELVVTQTITGKLQLPSATGGAIPMLGTTGAGSAAFNGTIDEVRISLGEVAVGDMLYAPPSGGLVLMYK